MTSLELKVPPPILLAVIAFAMWVLARFTPHAGLPAGTALAAGGLLVVLGLALNLAGVLTVRRFKTTFNPMRPDTATSLVSTGLFAWSRNPMYLGFLVMLLGWAVCLSSPAALAGPVAFVLYINRFQIIPEERALSSLFGASFAEYKTRVRRWL